MTLHESKHGGFGDLGRLHQQFLGDQPPAPPVPPPPVAPPPAMTPHRPQCALYEHADLGPLGTDEPGGGPDCYDVLAELAEPEDWSGRADKGPTWGLREYIEQTFERHHRQRTVPTSPDGSRTVFNTGLATAQQETIYGLFAPNRNPDGPPWQLAGWLAESDRRLHEHFPALPGFAEYTDRPADLVYDRRCELLVNAKHLLESDDNLAALPDPLRNNPYLAGLVLEGAVRRAEARVHRGPRTATPCWDPAAEQVRLLLPLSLTTPETVDVALAVAHEGEAYRGRRLLGLDLARTRARLLGRLDAWL